MLRNISDGGALIDFADGALVPDHFVLHNEMDGYKVDCEIVRRIGNSAGIAFIGPKEPIKATRRQVIDTPVFSGASNSK